MRIIIKNNLNGSVGSELVKKITKFYLTELVGSEKVNGIGTVKITFKKLIYRRGGYARWFGITSTDFEIIVNSSKSDREVFKILAHECTHIKQYFTGELFFKRAFTRSGRSQTITNWRGREYIRKNYRKQPWEIDARKGEKLACNILNKIDGKVPVIGKEPIEVKPTALNTTREIVISILNDGSIPNGDLVPRVLDGEKDKQIILKVLREVFALKQNGVIQEYSEGSLIYVRSV